MGLLDRVERRASALEPQSLANPGGWVNRLAPTASGMVVTEDTALNFLAVHACVAVIAESISTLPCKVLKSGKGGTFEAPDHPGFPLLTCAVNSETTAAVGRQVIQAQALLAGAGYAEIERDRGGRPLAIWPIHWRRLTPRRHPTSGELIYDVTPYNPPVGDGGVRQGKLGGGTIPETDMLRLPGLSLAGLRVVSPIAVAREAVGAGLASDRFLSAFFQNGSWPGGFIKLPRPLKDEDARRRFRESVEAVHQGPEKGFRIGVLEDGAEWTAASIPAEDAQLLQLRVDLRREIARLYRVPLHMIGDLERATFSNIEWQGIDFLVYTLLPWLVKWEQELARKLLSSTEQRSCFVKHNTAALLRGDTKSRYEAYASAISSGWMSPDEARALEDMNPIPGGKGAVYLFPLNMDQIGAKDKPKPSQRSALLAGVPSRAARVFGPLLATEMQRAKTAAVRALTGELDKADGSELPLQRLLPAWDRARSHPQRILAAPIEALCRELAVEYSSGLATPVAADLAAERAASACLGSEAQRMVGALRSAAEAAYVEGNGDPGSIVRSALAAAESVDASEVHSLLDRAAQTVVTQLTGGHHDPAAT